MDINQSPLKQIYSPQGIERIQKSHFLIVGIGGVGSWISEALIRSGALHVTLVDLDDICASNINRQIHALENNVGKLKVHEMKKRLLAINSKANINMYEDFFSEKTAESILSTPYDYVFDGIDSLKSKCLLLAKCRERSLPIICSGGAGGKLDPTRIQISDLNRTKNDPLLFRVRKELKRSYNFPKYENKKFHIPTVYSDEVVYKSPSETRANACSLYGSLCHVTASFGLFMAGHVLNQMANDI